MTTSAERPGPRRLWIAGAAVLAVLAAAVTWFVVGRGDGGAEVPAAVPTTIEPPSEERMLAGVEAVLNARASALLAGRLPQYLQYVDPENQQLRQRDQQVFANLRKLGLSRLSYQVDTNWAPEVQAQHGPSARALRVLMQLQIAGIDSAPRATSLGYTFAERDGRWLLVDDDDLAAETDLSAYREPWDLGAIEVARRPGVLVVVPAGERANAERLAREARPAIPIVRSITRRAQAGVLVVAMADGRSMSGEWRTGGHPAAAVAVPNFAPANPEASEFKVTGSRVVINPEQRTKADRLLLAHEFTHAAMEPLGDRAPIWLVEGFAMYVENKLAAQDEYQDEIDDQRQELLSEKIPALVVLPIDGVFHGDYDEDSYGVSWVIVEYLVTTYGQAKVNSLYADLARGPDAPAAREQVLRKHLKVGETALVAALKKYDGPG
ncbi:hypothetical protein ABZX12_38670 [Kribbella sp. NPDC003505]|uniref:peptidase MA family metallohydrolase n=1 Tax=Kribbella sp. NPDC003505 TaxID=3154448 RepID=UPI0033AA25BA